MTASAHPTIDRTIGATRLIRLQRIVRGVGGERGNVVLAKLEGDNPAGSVKDRPALAMIERAEQRGEICPGDTLIEATSGNTGIALAMVAAIRGYRMVLVMPENLSIERRQAMKAYGAELVLVDRALGMEGARDRAQRMQREGQGRLLDQFANDDNWAAHFETTGPEIWNGSGGAVTHFVSAMGTTGTITGVSRYLKERSPGVVVIGAQPADGSSITGIRRWNEGYVPAIYRHARVDRLEDVTQDEAEETMRRLAAEEGVFCGPSSGGACAIALRVAVRVRDATIVFIVCDRGDRYLSMGLFPA